MTKRRCWLCTMLMGLFTAAVAMLMLAGCSSGGDTSTTDVTPSPTPKRHLHRLGAPAAPGAPTSAATAAHVTGARKPHGPQAAAPIKPVVEIDPSHLPIEKAPLKSPITHVRVKSGSTSIEYLRFKYRDYDGSTAFCEMPASEAQVPRSADEWVTTFSTYKQEPPAPKVAKKQKKQPESVDYPFVSPRGSGE